MKTPLFTNGSTITNHYGSITAVKSILPKMSFGVQPAEEIEVENNEEQVIEVENNEEIVEQKEEIQDEEEWISILINKFNLSKKLE